MAGGERAKAIGILQAVDTLKLVEEEQRSPTEAERQVLQQFSGFGPVALHLFPNPVTGQYRDAGWEVLGRQLESLLTPEEYASARRTTFNAFYTSPDVIGAIHRATEQLGVPSDGLMLEPGCGVGNFIGHAAGPKRFIGVELDSLSARIAKALYPQHDIRQENFRDTHLADGSLDAVVGNVPFADVKMDHRGTKYSLHDYFFAKSVDALRSGGILALVTSHFTLDKQNAAIREYLAGQADFLGAIRLPSDAFKHEGTAVVTDIVFLRKRGPDEPAAHVDPDWLQTGSLTIDGADVAVNQYFRNHPEMVLGTWSRKDTLYGGEGFSVESHGDLKQQLQDAVQRLPRFAPATPRTELKSPAPQFVPPPDEPHISVGSFFVGNDGAICQSEGSGGVPVVYGGRALRADGTMTGRRMALLLELRDRARRVLRSQNEAWPEEHRQQARRELNRSYDRFVATYGPINRTTFSETKDGSLIRRMPNIVKFREDPDAMLVMSLEDYDEVTGQATKTDLMLRDVVGSHRPVTHVNSAEEGLLVSLNQQGCVNPEFIATLYGQPVETVLRELGDLIFRNPATQLWETADDYLSGNVRQKLEIARAAGPEFERNAQRLESVQPEDVLPGDIDANLGAPWIPVDDMTAFVAHLFGVPPPAVRLSYVPKDAVWHLDTDCAAESSVAATSDFGTLRANGTRLLELALNMKSPTIYDTIHTGDREERVINQQETMAAREKQRLIKETFRSWIFSDPDRTERLVRIYNDLYNNLRPRRFDGAHLDFPGMNENLNLRPHQKDAVWRGMSSGNTLLAHVVGAGKTFTMAATGMKMKQAGLIHKPMYVVPNHLLEQFAREFMQLYPNARLLVASKDDLTRDRRKLLTARIAGGEWDGIIVTHSSFERIGMSRHYRRQFLEQQIEEYDQLLREHAADRGTSRNLIKSIEKQKAAREERLRDLLAEDKKDDGLVFDELGVDHLFIDEAHAFKNLETPTKMERVAGIQTGGSERAFDVYMKARYLSEKHPGHGVTFATGTPISNTMVEMYTMQRFLDPEGLRSRGIEHFDAWAATFGEVIDTMEIAPDGSGLRPRSRFARFTNLPELQQMFRSFSDVQTADMLNLPRPSLKDGKPKVVAAPMSPEQQALQDKLVERYERLRSQKIDPRIDNALAITTDGRKLATDARMLDPNAADFPDSKINQLVNNVYDIWQQTTESRGTQLIFSDIGVHPTAWGYSPYQEIVRKLIDRGIPPDQIAAIGEADSDAKKQVLFEKVRNGSVRILLGSTQKMGTGTNVQKQLVALHHLDAPWKPAEVEQREGRILRQGNLNPEVSIFRYVTEGSFDAYMWQALETKARFIGQVITGDNTSRQSEDVGSQELSYAEVKAIASGNPAVLTLSEADAELRRLAMLKKNHMDEQYTARRKLKELPDTIRSLRDRHAGLTADLATVAEHDRDDLRIAGHLVPPDDVVPLLNKRLSSLPPSGRHGRQVMLGTCQGLDFGIRLYTDRNPEVYIEGQQTRVARLSSPTAGGRAILNAVDRLITGLQPELLRTSHDIDIAESQLRDYQTRLGQEFPHTAYQTDLRTLRDTLNSHLTGHNEATTDNQQSPAELADQIKALIAKTKLESATPRATTRSTDAEEPVTTTILRKRLQEHEEEPNTASDSTARCTESVWQIGRLQDPTGRGQELERSR